MERKRCHCGLCLHARLKGGFATYEDMADMLRLRKEIRQKNIVPEYIEGVIEHIKKVQDEDGTAGTFGIYDWWTVLSDVLGLDPDLGRHEF